LELPSERIHALVSEAEDNTVLIDLRGIPDANEVSIPLEAIQVMGYAELYMYLHLPDGSVWLDADAVQSLAGQANGGTITLSIEPAGDMGLTDEQGAFIYGEYYVHNVVIYAGDDRLDDWDGLVTITLPTDVEDPTVWLLDEDGTLVELSAIHDAEEQTVTFAIPGSAAVIIGQCAGIHLSDTGPPLQQMPAPFMQLEIGQQEYIQEGVAQFNDVAPFVDADDATVMVPLRMIAEALGAEVEWHRATRSVTVDFQGETFVVEIGQELPDGLGTSVIQNGRTFVSTCHISTMLGITIIWDSVNQSIAIHQLM